MAAIGGSIKEVTVHGRIFKATGDADATRDLGGFEVALEPNGDRSVRKIMTAHPWMFEGITLEIDDSRDDQQYLKEVQLKTSDGGMGDITVEFASGAVFAGVGTVTGRIQYNNQATAASVALGGPGDFARQ